MLALARNPAFLRYANPPALASNVITSPNDQSNASWNVKYEMTTVVSNTTLAPDGSMDADKIGPTVTNDFHGVAQTTLTTTGGTWIARARLKQAGNPFGRLIVGSTNTYTKNSSIIFDLGGGTIANAASITYVGAPSVRRLANGWLLYEIIIPSVDANSTHRLNIDILRDPNTSSFAGVTASGLYVWGVEFAPAPN